MSNRRGHLLLDRIRQAEQDSSRPVRGFAGFIRQDLDAVTAGLTLQWSSGIVEGHVNRRENPQKGHEWPSLLPTAADPHPHPTMIFAIRAPVPDPGSDTVTVDANTEIPNEQPPLPPRPTFPDMTAARSRGPADAVEAQWQSLQLRWEWMRARQQIRSPGRPFPHIVELLEAAAAEPRLRRLYPFTSHFALLFSSSTSYPWTVQAGAIEPLHNGRFMVRRRRNPSAVVGEVESAEEAVALALELLPTSSDPVITAPTRNPA